MLTAVPIPLLFPLCVVGLVLLMLLLDVVVKHRASRRR